MRRAGTMVCSVALGATVPVSGLGIRLADQDPVATARGNAFVATADNPSAVYYNPAGLTQLTGHRARLGFYGVDFRSKYRSATGATVESKEKPQLSPQLYYAYSSAERGFAVGLGVYAPYGLSLEWPDSSGFRTLAVRGRITYLTANPVLAWQPLPGLSVGAGATLNYAEADLRRGLVTPGDQFRFEGDDFTYGYNLGLRWQPHTKHAFGVTYRSATTATFEGTSRVMSFVPFIASGTGAANAEFKFPHHVVFGYSFRPTERWNLEFNADWTDWDQLNTVVLNDQVLGPQLGGPVLLPFNWKSSWFYEVGVTRRMSRTIDLSAGYIYSENSVPDANFNPIVPDSDRHIFSVGAAWQGSYWSLALAYQLAYGPDRTVSGSGSTSLIGETADGRYRFLSHGLSLALGCAF